MARLAGTAVLPAADGRCVQLPYPAAYLPLANVCCMLVHLRPLPAPYLSRLLGSLLHSGAR